MFLLSDSSKCHLYIDVLIQHSIRSNRRSQMCLSHTTVASAYRSDGENVVLRWSGQQSYTSILGHPLPLPLPGLSQAFAVPCRHARSASACMKVQAVGNAFDEAFAAELQRGSRTVQLVR